MSGAATSAFLPTIVTSGREVYERNLPLMARVMGREEFAGRVLGIHVEGPFISAAEGARGAHDLRHICPPDVEFLKRILEWGGGCVRMLTVAAELEGVESLIEYAVGAGVTVSLGHQMAGPEALGGRPRRGRRH